MESKSKCKNHHIVMLPFMAHGHLIPFLALATQIYQKTGFKITIANTPLNIQYIRSTINSTHNEDKPTNFNLVELPFSAAAEYGLPPNTENSENLPLDLIGQFFAASATLKNPVRTLLSDIVAKDGQPPLCVISDVFFGWANDVAKSVGSVNVTFTTCGAYGTLAYTSVWMNLPYQRANSDEFHVPGFPEQYRFHFTQPHKFMREADGSDIWSKFMQAQISNSFKSFGFLCNTVEEFEPLGLELFRKFTNLPVWSIGPLLPHDLLKNGARNSSSGIVTTSTQRAGKKLGVSTEKCLQFLDLHGTNSVLYISFGSQNSINPSQMMQLAIALEESAKPFIWVIRPPVGFDRNSEFKPEWLPERFEERVTATKQGLLVRNWAPQLEILSHGSTGAFMSHCGWNSVMESLSQGVPIIGWPIAAEQAFDSKMLVEELRVSVELTRGTQSKVEWGEIKNVIELVMGLEGKGDEMRQKGMEIAKLIRQSVEENGSFFKALDDFVTNLLARVEDCR
ncbi:UDP-glycosyltransferase 92A1-like [Mercurialis annua]|uniref:UDP-glycosyltransferase 92A1-like n=1 Tax=Mercurialis annua TaxID=3986 RepID=UPI00215F48E2|nr:UDP-glycosyltransferase 92A1-like [Mercurialis annua]